jgi:uncharacterized protein
MKQVFADIVTSKVLISCLSVIVVTQIIKILNDMRNKCFGWWSFFETGGMPSSHSALVTALTASIFFEQGISALFIACAVFSAIVIRDAFGVRQATGQNTKMISEIIDILKLEKKMKLKRKREIMGHTPLQAAIGILIGAAATVIIYMII